MCDCLVPCLLVKRQIVNVSSAKARRDVIPETNRDLNVEIDGM
jgi:hypothetical protein